MEQYINCNKLTDSELMHIQGGKGPSKFDRFVMGWEFMEGFVKGYKAGNKKWKKITNR